jgi:hypothetical protein
MSSNCVEDLQLFRDKVLKGLQEIEDFAEVQDIALIISRLNDNNRINLKQELFGSLKLLCFKSSRIFIKTYAALLTCGIMEKVADLPHILQIDGEKTSTHVSASFIGCDLLCKCYFSNNVIEKEMLSMLPKLVSGQFVQDILHGIFACSGELERGGVIRSQLSSIKLIKLLNNFVKDFSNDFFNCLKSLQTFFATKSICQHSDSFSPPRIICDINIYARCEKNIELTKGLYFCVAEILSEILILNQDIDNENICSLLVSIELMCGPLTAAEVISNCIVCRNNKVKMRTVGLKFLVEQLNNIRISLDAITETEVRKSISSDHQSKRVRLVDEHQGFYTDNEDSSCSTTKYFGILNSVQYFAYMEKTYKVIWATAIDSAVLDPCDTMRGIALSMVCEHWLSFGNQSKSTGYKSTEFDKNVIKVLLMKFSDKSVKVRGKAAHLLGRITDNSIICAIMTTQELITTIKRLLQVADI